MSKKETQSEALRLADELMEPTLWPTDIRNLGAAELRRLDAENKALRGLAATCCAGLGAECNLPENWLDALSAAANGEPFDSEGLLPFTATVTAPVAGQCRFKGEKVWELCTAEHVQMELADPRYGADGYEVRYLYAAPQAAAKIGGAA